MSDKPSEDKKKFISGEDLELVWPILIIGGVISAISFGISYFICGKWIVTLLLMLILVGLAVWISVFHIKSMQKEDQSYVVKVSFLGIFTFFIIGITPWLGWWIGGFVREKNEINERKVALQESFSNFYNDDWLTIILQEPLAGESEGKLFLTNRSHYKWKSVYIYLNPPEGVLDNVKFRVEKFGFRWPPDNPTSEFFQFGGSIGISLDRFVHTETGEKFSTQRFVVKKVYIHAVVLSEYGEVECTCIVPLVKKGKGYIPVGTDDVM
jgi:hypothetical protein